MHQNNPSFNFHQKYIYINKGKKKYKFGSTQVVTSEFRGDLS